jgi:hypothetical protein
MCIGLIFFNVRSGSHFVMDDALGEQYCGDRNMEYIRWKPHATDPNMIVITCNDGEEDIIYSMQKVAVFS